jgi:ribonuclease HI
MIEVYVASTQGGWGVVLIEEEGPPKKYKGAEKGASHMRMALKGAIEGLNKTEENSEVKLFSNVKYLIEGINDAQKREKNRDLWTQIDELMFKRRVDAQYISPNKWVKEAHQLAREASEDLRP